jgi:hypothetical protein
MLKKSLAILRCAEELTGKNSVNPCNNPKMRASKRDMKKRLSLLFLI